MTILLMMPIGLAASVGRGYLAGVGVLVTIVFLAQIIAAIGYGNYFPWSVPALFSGLADPDQTPPGPLGYTFVALVGAAGIPATILWWRNADQDRWSSGMGESRQRVKQAGESLLELGSA